VPMPARGPLTMTPDEAIAALEDRHDLLRIQTLDFYNVASDERKHELYAAGEPWAMTDWMRSWLQELRDRAASGRSWRIAHVVREPLGAYLRYQFEWGYAVNRQAGQDIRVLTVDDAAAAQHLFDVGDYWLVDYSRVVIMHYGEDRAWAGASTPPAEHAAAYAALSETTWRAAEPFDTWWAARPQFHRDPGGVPAID
jgi:hypothetical protein